MSIDYRLGIIFPAEFPVKSFINKETNIRSNKEPKRLRRGKAFHKEIQDDWINTAEGQVLREKAVNKPTGRKAAVISETSSLSC